MATLRRWVREADEKLHLPAGDISVIVIGPSESHRLNKEYRGKDRPTNVLTFPADRGSGECGDILLCMSVIRREAKETQQSVRDYTKFLLQHGCIHLLGLDHHTEAEAKRWARYEKKLV
jgi:probable rRNA maturation factor